MGHAKTQLLSKTMYNNKLFARASSVLGISATQAGTTGLVKVILLQNYVALCLPLYEASDYAEIVIDCVHSIA